MYGLQSTEMIEHEATLEFRRANHKIYIGNVVATLPMGESLIGFVRKYGDVPALRHLMECPSCPIFLQDAPWAEETIYPDYGTRIEGTDSKPATIDITCPGMSYAGARKAGSEDNLPCIHNFKKPQSVKF